MFQKNVSPNGDTSDAQCQKDDNGFRDRFGDQSGVVLEHSARNVFGAERVRGVVFVLVARQAGVSLSLLTPLVDYHPVWEENNIYSKKNPDIFKTENHNTRLQ